MTGVIVHEWIEKIGGSENVLEEIANVYPDAPIYCLWNDAPERFSPGRVRESWLAKTPLRRVKPLALFFMPFIWRRLKIEFQPDWILASTHLFAHHARFVGYEKVKKIAYVHSPARYIWSPELDSRGKSFIVRIIAPALRFIDRFRAQEIFSIAANSKTVQQRIANYWNRESQVIYPPVDTDFFGIQDHFLSKSEKSVVGSLPQKFVLGASRFVEYKRLDLAIKFAQANSLPLVLAGSGPDEAHLRKMCEAANLPDYRFILCPSTALLNQLLARAEVFVFGAIEDFGILPVEAMAAGTPVLGPSNGGVSESVVSGVSGVILEEFTDFAMVDAYDQIQNLTSENIKNRSLQFSKNKFSEKLILWISQTEKKFHNK